jgi:hypothetical protein
MHSVVRLLSFAGMILGVRSDAAESSFSASREVPQRSKWEGRGNKAEFADRTIRPMHDSGYSATTNTRGKRGEIGGVIWRDEAPAFYGARVGPLTLRDELFASGKLAFVAQNV